MAWSNSRSVQVAGGLVQNRPTLDPEVGIGRILGVVGDQVYHTLDRKADWAWSEAIDTAHGNQYHVDEETEARIRRKAAEVGSHVT